MSEPLIAVAMSGGVDSSAVAGLLLSNGCNIVGMTMQLWNQRRLPELQTGATTGRCCSLDDVYDARSVASHLGIPYYVVNFEEYFESQVVRPFIKDYLSGRTPIPCTLCNNFLKWDQFLEMAAGVGAEKMATGHYARLARNPKTGRFELRRGRDHSKDQSYFLFGLTQEQLSKTLFPLGDLTKPEVRELAREMGIPVADKSESQEICFVPNGDYAAFIEAYRREQGLDPERPRGEIVTTGGRVLGEHAGVHRFTIGQRKGLGITVGEPLYVIQTDPGSRRVVVGEQSDLLCDRFTINKVNWVSIAPPSEPFRASVRIRHQHRAAPATVTPAEDASRGSVCFDEAQRAVTPGQAAVFYDGDLVLGGGWIENR